MAVTDVPRDAIWEDTGCVLRARVEGSTGGNLFAADVSALELKVFDTHVPGSTAVFSWDTSSPSTEEIHALKTGGWNEDTIGYNLHRVVPASVFVKADRVYRCEMSGTPSSTSEPAWKAVWSPSTKGILGS